MSFIERTREFGVLAAIGWTHKRDHPGRGGGVDLASQEDLPGYHRRHVGLAFQLQNLLPQLSAIQNVEVAMFSTGLSRRERRDRARSLLGPGPGTSSPGMPRYQRQVPSG